MTIQELQNEINEADKKFAERRAVIEAEMDKLQKELKSCYARVGEVIVENQRGTQYSLAFSKQWDGRRYEYPIKAQTYAEHLTRKQGTTVTPDFKVVSYKKNY